MRERRWRRVRAARAAARGSPHSPRCNTPIAATNGAGGRSGVAGPASSWFAYLLDGHEPSSATVVSRNSSPRSIARPAAFLNIPSTPQPRETSPGARSGSPCPDHPRRRSGGSSRSGGNGSAPSKGAPARAALRSAVWSMSAGPAGARKLRLRRSATPPRGSRAAGWPRGVDNPRLPQIRTSPIEASDFLGPGSRRPTVHTVRDARTGRGRVASTRAVRLQGRHPLRLRRRSHLRRIRRTSARNRARAWGAGDSMAGMGSAQLATENRARLGQALLSIPLPSSTNISQRLADARVGPGRGPLATVRVVRRALCSATWRRLFDIEEGSGA